MKWKQPLALGVLFIGLAACTNRVPDGAAPDVNQPADIAPPVDVPEADIKALVEGNNQFAFDLFKQIAETQTGNILLSPYSISSALAMTYTGARGKTAEEMAKVLGLTGLAERTHPAHATLARKLRTGDSTDGPEFRVANALWGQKGLPLRPEFLHLTQHNYESGLREVDFAGETAGACGTINKWVGEQTRDKIPELLKLKDVDSATKLVLTNAVYFRADWANPFRKADTVDEPFHRTRSDQVKVPLMRQDGEFGYAAVGDAELLEMPYFGRPIAMVVVLPKSDLTLAAFEMALTADRVKQWLGQMQKQHVRVTFPRFKSRTAFKLNDQLSQLGMPTAFSEKSDLSGIFFDARGIRITNVIHETFVAVDERGTEAAAATAVVSGGDSAPVTIPFQVDRPFLMLIRDTVTGCVLFIGRVFDPTSPAQKK